MRLSTAYISFKNIKKYLKNAEQSHCLKNAEQAKKLYFIGSKMMKHKT